MNVPSHTPVPGPQDGGGERNDPQPNQDNFQDWGPTFQVPQSEAQAQWMHQQTAGQATPGSLSPDHRAPTTYAQYPRMQPPKKTRKSLFKRWWFWVLVVIALIFISSGLIGGGDDMGESTSASAPMAKNSADGPAADAPDEEAPTEEAEEPIAKKAPVEEKPADEPEVPSEFEAALSKAQTYIDTMHFSKVGLLDQLTSEYGEQYDEDAAQYAVDNVDADWNKEALEAA